MTLSTSLLVMDGNNYRFSHRSFQEYFCALYVASRPDDSFHSAVEAVSARYRTDSVLYFTASISRERFERIWVAPKLPRALTQYKAQKNLIGSYKKFISKPDGDFLAKLRDVYGMSASNACAASLIAKFRDIADDEPISSGANRNLGRIPLDELGDFVDKDIQQFETLHRSITIKYQEQSTWMLHYSALTIKIMPQETARRANDNFVRTCGELAQAEDQIASTGRSGN